MKFNKKEDFKNHDMAGSGCSVGKCLFSLNFHKPYKKLIKWFSWAIEFKNIDLPGSGKSAKTGKSKMTNAHQERTHGKRNMNTWKIHNQQWKTLI